MLKIQYWLLLLLWFSEVGKAVVRDADLSACFLQLQTCVLGEKSRLNVNAPQLSHHLNCVVFGK